MKKNRKWRTLSMVLAAQLLATPVGAQTEAGISADSSPEYQAAMDALQAQWEADVAAAAGQPPQPVAMAASMAATASTLGGYLCFPTCAENDSKMLALAGRGYATLAGDFIELKITAPGTANSVEIGFFDGDTGGQWDALPLPIDFVLYADPAGDGSGTIQVGSWASSQMADNAWHTVSVATAPDAQTPDGGYTYLLRVTNPSPSTQGINVFKVRTDAVISASSQAFSFMAALRNLADAKTVYPNYPTLTPTTYDGIWNFYLQVPENAVFVELWNGDMDFGSFDLADNDTDDPNTVGNPFLPAWATGTAATFEGVAIGQNGQTGSPPDDNVGTFFTRSPSVRYTLYAPDGTAYADTNPSGNLEWEKFRIDTAPYDASVMDHHADTIPAGLWRVEMTGVDMQNLNAWRFDYELAGSSMDIAAYRIGDFVWHDDDGDGVLDDGESGISSVTVNLIDGNGTVVNTTTTDRGLYFFDVPSGDWKTQVAPENFITGGPLASYVPTVDYTGDSQGDNERTQTVVDSDILTYDYGYWAPPPPPALIGGEGCTPGYWKQKHHYFAWTNYTKLNIYEVVFGIEAYHPNQWMTLAWALKQGGGGEDALGRHAVAALLNSNSAGVDYAFTEAQVIALVQEAYATGNLEGVKNRLAVENESGCNLGNGSSTETFSASTMASGQLGVVDGQWNTALGNPGIAGTVWDDVDGDGYYEPGAGEQGIVGVQMLVTGDTNGDGTTDYSATVSTSDDGTYFIEDLSAGQFTVTVSDENFHVDGPLEHMSQSTDKSDSYGAETSRMNPWNVSLAAGQSDFKADFGYETTTGYAPPPISCSGSLSQAGWSLYWVDSEETVYQNGAAVNAFDGNPNTIWHTKWGGGSDPMPHDLYINLGSVQSIGGVRYLPRQDGSSNGNISEYDVWVSTDPNTNGWTWLKWGTFADDQSEKTVSFDPVDAQYVALKAWGEAGNSGPWSSAAEINVIPCQ